MFYIGGTLLPHNKKVYYSLTHIYGLGKKQAFNICARLGISPKLLIKDLDQNLQILLIKNLNNLLIQKKLKTKIRRTIDKEIKLKTYRGLRLKLGLPVHGQRTHSNYKTSRKKLYI